MICPQVLHAGASLCMLLAAAFTALIPASALIGFEDCLGSGLDNETDGFATTLTSLNSCVFF